MEKQEYEQMQSHIDAKIIGLAEAYASGLRVTLQAIANEAPEQIQEQVQHYAAQLAEALPAAFAPIFAEMRTSALVQLGLYQKLQEAYETIELLKLGSMSARMN